MLCARRDRTTRSPEPNQPRPVTLRHTRINGEACSQRSVACRPAFMALILTRRNFSSNCENIKVRGAWLRGAEKSLWGICQI